MPGSQQQVACQFFVGHEPKKDEGNLGTGAAMINMVNLRCAVWGYLKAVKHDASKRVKAGQAEFQQAVRLLLGALQEALSLLQKPALQVMQCKRAHELPGLHFPGLAPATPLASQQLGNVHCHY